MELFAQVDSLSGSGGWLGAGLFGLVLAWLLLVHLPAKDKQLMDLIESKDAALKLQRDKFVEEQKAERECHEAEQEKARAAFEKALDTITAHCKDETRQMIEVFTKEMQRAKQ